MMLIGPRERLKIISDNFKNVFVSLIKSFNGFKSGSQETAMERISAMRDDVAILEAEVLKKIKETGRNDKLISLSTSLLALKNEVGGFVAVIPSSGKLTRDHLRNPKALFELRINEIKSILDLCLDDSQLA